MMVRGWLVATIVVSAAAGAQAQTPHDAQGAAPPAVTYEEFMKIAVEERRGLFDGLSPEDKSRIVRTHAEQWLASNRARLTDSEVGVLQGRIEFVARNRYVRHPQAERDKAEQASRAKTACWVNPEDLAEVFDVLGTRSRTRAAAPKWTYLR